MKKVDLAHKVGEGAKDEVDMVTCRKPAMKLSMTLMHPHLHQQRKGGLTSLRW